MEETKNPQVIYSWKAPLRPYKKRSSLILRFYLAVALLLSTIIFFFGDKILLIPIWSILFLFYTLTITPPPEIENKITLFGIETVGITVRWESLSHFYFGQRFSYYTLTIVGRSPFFHRLFLVVPNEKIKNDLLHLLSQHLIYQEKPQRNFSDKLIDWLSTLIPDEEVNRSEEGSLGVSAKSQPASL